MEYGRLVSFQINFEITESPVEITIAGCRRTSGDEERLDRLKMR